MGKVTFILDTSADTLAAWLLANWRAPHGASETGSLQGQSLRESRQSSGARVLTADVIWVSHQHDEEGRAQAQPLREAFRFRLQPLAAQRVEVTAECLFHYGLLGELARLLEDIARRWPELRDTLEHSPDYWDFDSFPPENETQQTLLDAFTARLERLKERNVKPLALQGANACGAVFYLDNTTAREAATWLAENWRRRNYEPNVWTWTTDYHHARRYKTTPLQEATDGHGRALLTVGMVEWETHHPNPLSVPFGPLAIPQDQGFIVQDNPRGLEILLIQAGSDLVQVEARCNALLLLHSFTQLLKSAKTAYGDRLRNIAPTFGVMDAAPPRTHAMMDAYFTARADEFRDLVIEIEPKYARLLGGTARADGPAAPSTGPASELASDAARVDETDPDSIPQWGRRRDLSTHEVREIVRRFKEYKAAGGSIAKFHNLESQQWPDPEDSPRAYSAKTLEKWLKQKRFQS